MKLRYNLLTILIGLCLVACNQNSGVNVPMTSMEPQPHFQQAMNNVLDVIKTVNPTQYKILQGNIGAIQPHFYTSDILDKVYGESSYTHLRKQAANQVESHTDTLLYIVNFEDNQGFAIMSANDSLLGDMIFAIADTGSISLEDFYDTNNEDDNGICAQNPSTTIGGMVNNYLDDLTKLKKNKEIVLPEYPMEPYIYKYGNWTTAGKIAPRIKIKIDQDSPYNKYCFTSNGQQALAGCVAIAIVQMMSANKYPTSFGNVIVNWDNIIARYKTDNTQKDALAKVIAVVGKQCKMNYGVSSSSAYMTDAKSCIASYSRYQNVALTTDVSLEVIEPMLNNLLPVVMSGTRIGADSQKHGHAWTIDGWLHQERTVTCYVGSKLVSTSTQRRKLVHCVYGWGGWCDGYYNLKVFDLNKGPVERENEDKPYGSTMDRNYKMDYDLIKYSF